MLSLDLLIKLFLLGYELQILSILYYESQKPDVSNMILKNIYPNVFYFA